MHEDKESVVHEVRISTITIRPLGRDHVAFTPGANSECCGRDWSKVRASAY